ncbi:MAG TPA: hypothetical protein VNQ73_16495 [Ilumatobacter sp.]|nr:hypothetical protein [Ilumatobacter sp.]
MNFAKKVKVTIDVVADNARKSLKDLKKEISEAEGVTGKFKAAWSGAGTFVQRNAAAITAAGLAIGGGLYKLSEGAASTDAAFASLNQIAGETVANDVAGWAKDGVEAFGMSDRAIYTHSTTLAGIGDAAKLSGEELSRFINEHLRMSADFAAFADTSPDQVMKDLRSAYNGSSETLQKYQVDARESTLKTLLLNEAGIEVTGTLTQQERVLGVNLALKQKHAQIEGQWRRESGELLGQQVQFKANLENLGDAIGRGALPMMTGLTKTASEMVGVLDSLPGPIKSGIGGLGGMGAAAALASVALVKVVNALKAAKLALLSNPWVAAATGAVLALSTAAKAMDLFGGSTSKSEEAVRAMNDALKASPTPIETFRNNVIDALSANDLFRESLAASGLTWDDVITKLGQGEVGARNLAIAIAMGSTEVEKNAAEWAEVERQLVGYSDSADYARKRQAELEQITKNGTKATEGQVTALGRASTAERDYTRWLEQRGREADETRRAEEALTEATERASAARRAAVDAGFAVRDAERDYRAAVERTVDVLFDAESSEDDRAAAIDDSTQAAIRLADETVRLAQETDEANGTVRDAAAYQQLWNESMADSAGRSTLPQVRDQIRGVIDELNNMPTERVVNVNVRTTSTGGVRAYAKGTPNHPGGLAVLGEDGPELAELPAGTRVHTAAQTRRILGNNAGTTNVYVNMPQGSRPDDVVRAIERHRRRNGL